MACHQYLGGSYVYCSRCIGKHQVAPAAQVPVRLFSSTSQVVHHVSEFMYQADVQGFTTGKSDWLS
eukprot:1147492-Pelagomonas_calceolata.AAC.2